MKRNFPYYPDPRRDLVLEREIDVSVALVWEAWTVPEHLMQWFTPKPWETVACEIDLRPGGHFKTAMRSPEGQEFPNQGCFLEVVPQQRLAWTTAMEPGFRPAAVPPEGWHMSAIVEMESLGPSRTKYRATALHTDVASTEKHRAMGFEEGWGTALAQLVEWAKTRRR